MVRKTTAQVKSTTVKSTAQKATSSAKDNMENFDLDAFLRKLWSGVGENWMTYLGFFLVIIGVIQLRQFIVGIAFLTVGILLIAGLFSDIDKK